MGLIYLLGGDVERAPVAPENAPQDELSSFVGFVLDDVQSTWAEMLGDRYRPAKLVLFTDVTQTGCGYGSAAAGPFYCPRDQNVYIDLSFYRQLRERFGAPGDFAQAYVIAHEVGHHVQNQLGLLGRGVETELMADCFAGVWAASARKRDLVEVGDFREALDAAAAIGDDRLQQQSGQAVNPETWTHGSSEQRMRWFSRGFEDGDPNACGVRTEGEG
jgi:predicted metalloprotease